MKVLHSSDLHGNYKRLLVDHAESDFDVWLDTGDFFDNFGRKRTGRIEPVRELQYQTKWLGWTGLLGRFTTWLRGRPALIMPGNHDFISLAPRLKAAGANAQAIPLEGTHLLGMKWAGFREIPYIDGEWAGEEVDFTTQIEGVLASSPDILVTHGPPGGILDDEEGYGCPALTSALMYQAHNIRFHFFGHVHRDGGKTEEALGIRFVNGATKARIHNL